MNSRSSQVRATGETQAYQKRFKTKKATPSTMIDVDAGHVSKKKLSALLSDDTQAGNTFPIPQKLDTAKESNSLKNMRTESTSSPLKDSDTSPLMNEESIEKAVERLIELNRNELSDSQLVDLIASFYLVTNQCLKKCKTDPSTLVKQESVEMNPIVVEGRKQGKLSQDAEAGTEEDERLTSTKQPISLLERKRIQWLQERAELELLERDRAKSVMDLSTEARSTAVQPVLSAKNHHRFQRCHYLPGLPVGEDPHTEAELKEQQRRQWLADLDRQVEERRVARERERLQRLALETADDIKEVERVVGAEAENSAVKCGVKSASFGRGRGLADLLGRQNTDSAAKRQQQIELQVAYAEQIRERAERRRQEREAEARMEAEEAARLEADCARLRQEQEAELARRREDEATKRAAMMEAQERASRETKVTGVEMPHKRRYHVGVQRPSRNDSHIPRYSNRTLSHQKSAACGGERMTKPKFGSTYTLPNQVAPDHTEDEKSRSKQYVTRGPSVVHTESTLPSVPLTTSTITAAAHPTSDFLSAITDPDFAYPQASRDSALRQVSRIKENLEQRQNELRSMQNF